MTHGLRLLAQPVFDVPVDPDADEARNWVLDELVKPQYEAAKPTWFDRLASAVWEWLNSLELSAGSGPSGLLIAAILVVAALVAAFLIFGLPALNRRSAVAGSMFGAEETRTAADIRKSSEEAARTGNFTLAIEERFRSLAKGLAERTILTISRGTTAHGFAVKAAEPFPAFADRLIAAADAFDGVRYLGRDGTAEAYGQIADLEAELRESKPNLPGVEQPIRTGADA